MKKTISIFAIIFLACASLLFGAIVNGFLDFTLRSTPSNPASGNARVYVSSSTNLLTCLLSSGASCMPAGISYPGSGIPKSTGSAWGTSYGAQGTDTNVLTSGTVSASAGTTLCTDANGGATTSGCTSGGGGSTTAPYAFGSLPSCSTAAFYQITNSVYTNAYCDGVSMHYYYGGVEVYPPLSGSFTAVNYSSCSNVTTYGGIYATCSTFSGQGFEYTSYPGGAFTRTAAIKLPISANFQGAGLGISDGTKMEFLMIQYNGGAGGPGLSLVYNATITTACCTTGITSITGGGIGFSPQAVFYLRYADDGTTNRTWSYSWDSVNWSTVRTESRTANLTPTEIGLIMNPQSTATTAWFVSFN